MADSAKRSKPDPSSVDDEKDSRQDFDAVDVAELRSMRSGLTEEETKVSYWRRLIQARIDVLNSDHNGAAPVEQLSRLLTDARSSHRRVAALSVGPVSEVPPLPDLGALWDRVSANTDTERDDLIADLRQAEAELSSYRRNLHERIDQVTAELIARYREDPKLALVAMQESLGAN